MTERMILKLAGIGAGNRAARPSWLRTLAAIRSLPEVTS